MSEDGCGDTRSGRWTAPFVGTTEQRPSRGVPPPALSSGGRIAATAGAVYESRASLRLVHGAAQRVRRPRLIVGVGARLSRARARSPSRRGDDPAGPPLNKESSHQHPGAVHLPVFRPRAGRGRHPPRVGPGRAVRDLRGGASLSRATAGAPAVRRSSRSAAGSSSSVASAASRNPTTHAPLDVAGADRLVRPRFALPLPALSFEGEAHAPPSRRRSAS